MRSKVLAASGRAVLLVVILLVVFLVIVKLLAAALLADFMSPDRQALGDATSMARSKIERMRLTVKGSFEASQDVNVAFRYARKNVAPTRRDLAQVLLRSGMSAEHAWFDVTVVTDAAAGGGLWAESVTIRMCARITVRLTGRPVAAHTANLSCPADLPQVGERYSKIEKTVGF